MSESNIESTCETEANSDINSDKPESSSENQREEQNECLSEFKDDVKSENNNNDNIDQSKKESNENENIKNDTEAEQIESQEAPEIKCDKEGNFEEQKGVVNTEPYKHDPNRPNEFEHNTVPEYKSEYFDNGYKFRTEDNPARQEAGLDARVIRTEGQVKAESSSERNFKAQRETPDKTRDEETGKTKDDAGHLHATSEGGPNERGNLVAMDSQLNRHGEWREMERRCDAEIDKGNSVYRTIDIHYPDDTTTRPDYFDVNCSVSDKNGEHLYTFSDRMYNVDKESRNEIYEEGAKENESETAKNTHSEEDRNENRKIAALFGNVED